MWGELCELRDESADCKKLFISCAQKLDFKNREVFHNTNWESPPPSDQKRNKVVGDWLVKHDPEQYARENYERCARHVLSGEPFENSNAVLGYTYKPWTVRELLGTSEHRERDEDEGDWSRLEDWK